MYFDRVKTSHKGTSVSLTSVVSRFLELLIEINHVQIKMLEKFSKAKKALFVRGKKKVKQDVDELEASHEVTEKYTEKSVRFEQIEAVSRSFGNQTTTR